jgi:hypothetical protein
MSDNITITKIGGETGLSTVLNSGIVGSKLGGTLGLIKNENGELSFSSDGVTFTPLNSGGGGSSVDPLETPDVYLKVEKLFTMTPAGKKGVYLNGKWDRDLEWLAPADVPMTFSGGSFGWSGTRALARYKKEHSGKTYYLYIHNLEGYYYDDTTPWDELNIQNLEQFLTNIDSLGWSGDINLCYTISSNHYTPEQVTSTNFERAPEIDTFNANAMSADSGLIWNLFGVDEMGMGMSAISYNITQRGADSITFTLEDSPDSEVMSGWNDTHKGYIGFEKNFQYGRLILDDGVDYLSGKWIGYNDSESPMSKQFSIGKVREWKHETNNVYAAELAGEYIGEETYGTFPEHGGFGFMEIPLPHFPRATQTEWRTRYYTLGSVLFPTYQMRHVEIQNGGSGYVVGDLIKVHYQLCSRQALDHIERNRYRTNFSDQYLLLCVTSVNQETGAVTGVTDLTFDSIDTERLGGRVWEYRAFNRWIYGGDADADTPETQTLNQNATNGSGTGFVGTLVSKVFGQIPDYTPMFGAERDFYWLACKSLTGNTGDKFPEVYELYRIRTNLSPIQ